MGLARSPPRARRAVAQKRCSCRIGTRKEPERPFPWRSALPPPRGKRDPHPCAQSAIPHFPRDLSPHSTHPTPEASTPCSFPEAVTSSGRAEPAPLLERALCLSSFNVLDGFLLQSPTSQDQVARFSELLSRTPTRPPPHTALHLKLYICKEQYFFKKFKICIPRLSSTNTWEDKIQRGSFSRCGSFSK